MESKTPVIDKLVALGSKLYPTSVYFEVTHLCNGRCRYCYVEGKECSAQLDTQSVFLALDKLAEAGIMRVIFTGGEMFIRSDIIEILRYAMLKDFWLLGIMTNGTLLTKEHMDLVVENKDQFGTGVSMSIYSHIPEANDSYFGIPGALDKIVANGEYLMRHGVDVELKLNVLDFNLETFMDTFHFFRRKGFIVNHYAGTFYSPGKTCESLKGCTEKEFLKRYLQKIPPTELKARKDEFAPGANAREKKDFCFGRKAMICIDNIGNMKPCVAFPYSAPCNILDKGSLRDLLGASSTMKEVRAISKQDVAKCRDCSYSASCSPCLAEMNAEHGCLSFPSSTACSYTQVINEL